MSAPSVFDAGRDPPGSCGRGATEPTPVSSVFRCVSPSTTGERGAPGAARRSVTAGTGNFVAIALARRGGRSAVAAEGFRRRLRVEPGDRVPVAPPVEDGGAERDPDGVDGLGQDSGATEGPDRRD